MDYETPQEGEFVTYDGRPFRITAVYPPDASRRTRWLDAAATDGRSWIRTNFEVVRVGLTGGWVARGR